MKRLLLRFALVAFGVLLGGTGATLAQSLCGGIAGIPCPPGQFCELAPGECCCDFLGVCVDVSQACPAVCDPVCGCDGATYRNRCEARTAGISVDHPGPCGGAGSTVVLSEFNWQHRLFWESIGDALGYNVYSVEGAGPQALRCLYHSVPESSVLLQGVPAPVDPWMFRVTALLPTGEGPLWDAADCLPRAPERPCVCTLPPEVGPCDAVVPRWYHDYATGRCEEFIWGGCGGNANNFATEQECADACLDTCRQPAVHGDCDAAVPRWYHNVLTGRCEMFVWGGCGGNRNNFETVEECRALCPGTGSVTPSN